MARPRGRPEKRKDSQVRDKAAKAVVGKKDPSQDIRPKERSLSNARLKDLCMEDKAKVGELVKKLAEANKVKEEFERQLEQEREEKEKERETMARKFQESLQMLQKLKEAHGDIAAQKDLK